MQETRHDEFPSRRLAIALAFFWIAVGLTVIVLTAPNVRSASGQAPTVQSSVR